MELHDHKYSATVVYGVYNKPFIVSCVYNTVREALSSLLTVSREVLCMLKKERKLNPDMSSDDTNFLACGKAGIKMNDHPPHRHSETDKEDEHLIIKAAIPDQLGWTLESIMRCTKIVGV